MFTAIIALTLMILAMAALPLIITLIYKHFYNGHANRVLETGKGKRWMAPFILFVILFLAEVVLVVGLVMINFMNTPEGKDYSEASVDGIMTQAEADNSIYSAFDGSEVSGYEMTEKTKGDFTCQIYENANDDELPIYVIRITYNGSLSIGSWDSTVLLEDRGIGAMGDWDTADGNVMYAVISERFRDYEDMSYELNLYEMSTEEYDTGNLGTYDMPQPDATLKLNLR